MTIGEMMSRTGKKGIIAEGAFVFGIDMSADSSASAADFTAVTGGVCGICAIPSPRTQIRRYVDGDRAIPLSEGLKITLKLIPCSGDDVQRKIILAARNGEHLRCAYGDFSGSEITVRLMLPVISADTGDFPKNVFTVEFL